VQDPVYREIRPAQTRTYPPDWFERMAREPGVAFLVPTILPASSIVGAVVRGTHRVEYLDLVPTASGDPLLLENGGVVPGPGEVVLTEEAAERLDARPGATIELRATRSRGGVREHGSARMRVAAVLSPRAGTQPRIYAPLSFVLDVESYKEGLAVPARGWAGGTATPYLSFDGVVVVLVRPLDPVSEQGLAVNTGFTRVMRLAPQAFAERFGFPLPDGMHAYDLKVTQKAAQLSSVRAVREKLRGRRPILLPYALVQLSVQPEGSPLPTVGLSLREDEARKLGLPAPPWGGWARRGRVDVPMQVLVPSGLQRARGKLSLQLDQARGGPLSFELTQVGEVPGDRAWIPVELLGVLRTALDRPVRFDAARAQFTLDRGGFQGFRLYAADIDHVAPLVDKLRGEGIEVIAQADAIERIRLLDQGLTRIFWLVAAVGVTGGVAALVASLYAAVQRKRKELSVMRLLGFSRRDLFRFPVFQGAGIAALAFLVAGVGFGVLSSVINRVFARDLMAMGRLCQAELKMCVLTPRIWMVAVAVTLGIAVTSALLAAWKTTQIDPAEALREE